MIGRYHLWFTVQPADDLPGQWVAHCLDIDIVTQGTSLNHAVQTLLDAVTMTAVDDRLYGRRLIDRSRAPEEYWDVLFDIVRKGVRGDVEELLRKPNESVAALAGQLLVQVEVNDQLPVPQVPAVWEINAFRSSGSFHCHYPP